MDGTNKAPSAEKILSILVRLVADQHGVKVSYEFENGRRDDDALHR